MIRIHNEDENSTGSGFHKKNQAARFLSLFVLLGFSSALPLYSGPHSSLTEKNKLQDYQREQEKKYVVGRSITVQASVVDPDPYWSLLDPNPYSEYGSGSTQMKI